jgi:hypothetical protein
MPANEYHFVTRWRVEATPAEVYDVLAANHRWAMAKGEESLTIELARRRGETVAAPPGPTRFLRRAG